MLTVVMLNAVVLSVVTPVEKADSDKCTSLQCCGCIYCRKKFFSTGPSCVFQPSHIFFLQIHKHEKNSTTWLKNSSMKFKEIGES
jgi:hypothetical protein